MEPGPLPPHERPWRHPSELGPPPHEPTSTTGRVLIVASATVSLLLIGLLAIAITPNRSPSPIAASSTVRSAAGAATATPAAIASSSAVTTTASLPVVTPIGDDGWAVTTAEAVAGQAGWMQARLPSGDVVDIEVVATDLDAGLVVVTLPESADADGYQLASDHPGPSDTVLVNADDPKVVTMVDLAYLDVEEATPVLDDAGALVGLCTKGYDGTTLKTVDTMPGGDPGVDPISSTTNVETTEPTTIVDDDTTTTAATTTDSTSPDSTAPESTVAESTTVETTTPDTEASTTTESTVVESTGVDSTEGHGLRAGRR